MKEKLVHEFSWNNFRKMTISQKNYFLLYSTKTDLELLLTSFNKRANVISCKKHHNLDKSSSLVSI